VFYRVEDKTVTVELIGQKKGNVLLIGGKEFKLSRSKDGREEPAPTDTGLPAAGIYPETVLGLPSEVSEYIWFRHFFTSSADSTGIFYPKRACHARPLITSAHGNPTHSSIQA
jgi:hypothetical protein